MQKCVILFGVLARVPMVTSMYLTPSATDSQCPQYIALIPGIPLVFIFLLWL